jgi:uncharacterized phiE125 gp8 family phage protein
MPLILVSEPAAEPISLIEAKEHLRVDGNDDDMLISSLIVAAREYAESICRRVFVTQSWKLILDAFPSPSASLSEANYYGQNWSIAPGPILMAKRDGLSGYEIIPGVPPLQSVESIKYIDTDGVQQTLAPTTYKVDCASTMGRIAPAYGTSWPVTRNEISAVEVSFTSGYGTPAKVPRGIKNWMLIRIATLYANREEVAILPRGKVEPLPFVDRLLDNYRVLGY